MTAVLPKEGERVLGRGEGGAGAEWGRGAHPTDGGPRGGYIFLNPGHRYGAAAGGGGALRADGRRVPEIVPCLYENVALAGAIGYWQVTRASAGGGGARRRGHPEPGREPAQRRRGQAVVILAGGRRTRPRPGARRPRHLDPMAAGRPDQIGIVRNYVKWAYELARRTPCQLVPRPSSSLPPSGRGCYMTVAREVLMEPMDGVARWSGRAPRPLVTPAGTPRRSSRSRAGWSRADRRWRSPASSAAIPRPSANWWR